jgi:hypothetical protein
VQWDVAFVLSKQKRRKVADAVNVFFLLLGNFNCKLKSYYVHLIK